ncbi:MAG: hypothetical protein M1429_01520 [Patescibacteria group bacterium]|nr:hypothetical protein [Patescibacteria group bacterium]
MDIYLAGCIATMIVIFSYLLYNLGELVKTELYNYKRGRLNGMGMFSTPVQCKICHHNLVIAWLFLPIGIWYLLGWYLAGNKGYDFGYETGKSDQQQIDIVTKKLIDESYYKLD